MPANRSATIAIVAARALTMALRVNGFVRPYSTLQVRFDRLPMRLPLDRRRAPSARSTKL